MQSSDEIYAFLYFTDLEDIFGFIVLKKSEEQIKKLGGEVCFFQTIKTGGSAEGDTDCWVCEERIKHASSIKAPQIILANKGPGWVLLHE